MEATRMHNYMGDSECDSLLTWAGYIMSSTTELRSLSYKPSWKEKQIPGSLLHFGYGHVDNMCRQLLSWAISVHPVLLAWARPGNAVVKLPWWPLPIAGVKTSACGVVEENSCGGHPWSIPHLWVWECEAGSQWEKMRAGPGAGDVV